MIISNHHILYDGWSNGIILTELMEESLPEGKSINQLIDFNVVWRKTTK